MRELLLAVAAMAVFQNVLLTQGFGLSLTLRTSRRGRDVWLYGLPLLGFALATVSIAHPIYNNFLFVQFHNNMWVLRWVYPLLLVVILALLYIVVTAILMLWLPGVYDKAKRVLPLAAFNNLTVGMALFMANRNTPNFATELAMTLGGCLGFLLLNWLLLEGRLRLDNPQLPRVFRGMPVNLLYLGIIALALMGFR